MEWDGGGKCGFVPEPPETAPESFVRPTVEFFSQQVGPRWVQNLHPVVVLQMSQHAAGVAAGLVVMVCAWLL